MGEFFGAVAGALIAGVFGLWLLKKQDDSKIDSLLEGADRKNRKDISNNEIAFNEAAQRENAEINRKLNELIEEQNEQNNKNKEIANSIAYLKTKQTDKWEQKKIDADIISKSIVDWLELARDVASSISSSASETNAAYILYRGYSAQELLFGGLGKEEEADIMLEYMNNEVLKARQSLNVFFKSKYKFKLLFGKNKENDNLLNHVEKIETFLSDYAKSQTNDEPLDFIEKSKSKDEEFEKIMNDFIEECRVYFKTEWVKAKSGNLE